MIHPPEAASKTVRLTLISKPGQEDKIRWLKEWCLRNGEQVSDILFEKVEEMARLHGYPNGHSQTMLEHAGLPEHFPSGRARAENNPRNKNRKTETVLEDIRVASAARVVAHGNRFYLSVSARDEVLMELSKLKRYDPLSRKPERNNLLTYVVPCSFSSMG